MVEPVTVVMVSLRGSPRKFNLLAAHAVMRLQVAALSNRQLIGPSRLWMVCMERSTLSASERVQVVLSVRRILSRKGDVPPCKDLWWCLVQPSIPQIDFVSSAALQPARVCDATR